MLRKMAWKFEEVHLWGNFTQIVLRVRRNNAIFVLLIGRYEQGTYQISHSRQSG